MIWKDELKACLRSKRNLSQQLSETEGNMWAIIDECKEKLNLAATHEQRLEDEYAKISAEREARERVIDSLHQEATMWMDQFLFDLRQAFSSSFKIMPLTRDDSFHLFGA